MYIFFQSLTNVIKIIISPIIFFLGYILFVYNGKTSNIVYQAYVKSYCYTSGLITSFISYLISFFNKNKMRFSYLNNKNDKINNELRDSGYVVFNENLNEELTQELINLTKILKCTNNQIDKKIPKVFFDENKHTLPSYYYDEKELLNTDIVKKVIRLFDNFKVSHNYFRSKPYLISVNMWWSTKSNKVDTFSAQDYHFDLDGIKWLKYFVYLTDVTIENGPHTYVSGTHKPFSKPFSILKRGYKRVSDEEILLNYGSERIKKIYGNKGTIIIGDTSCFHKGMVPKKRHRLIFEATFSNSLFGPGIINKPAINEFNN